MRGGAAIGPLMILACTVIWGAAFLGQKLGSAHYGPFAFNCYRNLLGGAFLFLCSVIRDRFFSGARTSDEASPLVGGILSGVALFAAMMAQQLGIEHTTPGVSAFLTANYVLLVPLFAWFVGCGRPDRAVAVGVMLAIVGTFFICCPSGSSGVGFGPGEAWTLLCALLFAVQIMIVDRFARRCDVLRFSMIQLFVAAVCSAPFLLLPSEAARVQWSETLAGLPALLFVGIGSSGIAYTLQNLGQARTPPGLAAIVMSMESVFGALFGWAVLGDRLSPLQFVGCGLVFTATLVPQLFNRRGVK